MFYITDGLYNLDKQMYVSHKWLKHSPTDVMGGNS